jgi:hypothetical protein
VLEFMYVLLKIALSEYRSHMSRFCRFFYLEFVYEVSSLIVPEKTEKLEFVACVRYRVRGIGEPKISRTGKRNYVYV